MLNAEVKRMMGARSISSGLLKRVASCFAARNASFMAAKFVKGLTEEEAHVFQQQQQQHQHHVEGTFPSPANSVQSSTATTVSLLTDGPPELDKVPRWQPPDVILGSLNFNRTIRKWSSDKEQVRFAKCIAVFFQYFVIRLSFL